MCTILALSSQPLNLKQGRLNNVFVKVAEISCGFYKNPVEPRGYFILWPKFRAQLAIETLCWSLCKTLYYVPQAPLYKGAEFPHFIKLAEI